MAVLLGSAFGATVSCHVVLRSGFRICQSGGTVLNVSVIGRLVVSGISTSVEIELSLSLPSVTLFVNMISNSTECTPLINGIGAKLNSIDDSGERGENVKVFVSTEIPSTVSS